MAGRMQVFQEHMQTVPGVPLPGLWGLKMAGTEVLGLRSGSVKVSRV